MSRRANLTESPAVVTIGTINGGTRANIVPESVVMTGTIRTYNEKVRAQVDGDVKLTAEKIVQSAGAKAEVRITPMYATTVNDPALAAQMAPALMRAADGNVAESPLAGASEDFSFYAQARYRAFMCSSALPRKIKTRRKRRRTTIPSSSSMRKHSWLASAQWPRSRCISLTHHRRTKSPRNRPVRLFRNRNDACGGTRISVG